MKQKWRYNIHLAERKNVEITTSVAVADADRFYKLLQLAAKRQGIRLHPKSYYQLMIDVLGQQHHCLKLYFASVEGQPAAAAALIFFGKTVTYLHGGSDHQYRQTMAPHLLHWQALNDAFNAGYSNYDWFGISAAWPNLTKFKQGFGGHSFQTDGTFELPLHATWYNTYRFIKQTRSWISS